MDTRVDFSAALAARRFPAAALLLVLLLGLVAECDDNWDDGVIHASPTTGGAR